MPKAKTLPHQQHSSEEDEIQHSSESELDDNDYYSDEAKSDDLNQQEEELEDALGDVPLEQLVALRQRLNEPTLEKKRSKNTKPTTKPKRDKNAPAELSTKRAVGRFRQIVEPTKAKSRDPRFDDLSGKFNQGLYKQSYGFLKELEDKELQDVKLQIAKTKDPEEKERLMKLQQAIMSRKKSKEAAETRQKIKREWRKKQMERVSEGKKPFFLKESDVKRLELVEKFKTVKDKNLDKILEKRRKKNASKDRRYTPK